MTQDSKEIPLIPPPQHRTREVAATLVDSTPLRDPPAGSLRGASMTTGDLFRIVHQSLRGRYLILIVLSLVGGALGGLAGLRLCKRVYHSEALLRIAYSMPEVMQATDQNAPMAMFDTFMLSQRLLITSRRVIDAATLDPIWKATGHLLLDKPDRYFAEHLEVEIKPRSEYILITVKDEDPGIAQAAVTAVVNAYYDLYDKQDKNLDHQRTSLLEDRKGVLNSKVTELADQLKTASQEYGTSNLDTFYEAAADRLIKEESALADLRLAAAAGPSSMLPATSQPAGEPQPAAALTPEQIASTDPEMARRLETQRQLQSDVDHLTSMGLGPAHKFVIDARYKAEQAANSVAKYATNYQVFRAATGRNLSDPDAGPVSTAGKSPAEIKADIARMTQLHLETKQEMVNLGNKRLELQRQETELKSVREDLAQLTKRVGVLRAESSLGVGRLSVISSGEIPLSPDKDSRVKWMAGGSMAGMFLPFTATLGLGLLRRRYNFSDETQAGVADTMPLLGILPDLDDTSAEDRPRAAAHCVHQIRVLLGTRAARRKSSIYLITSVSSKEGKTSLTMSLGISFAKSGLRTLVVDCDLVGRHLTNALSAADVPGLHEALNQGTLQKLIKRTPDGLYVLTAGGASAADAAALSGPKIATMFAQARRYFEVVLVDSGPILGSLEAATVGPEVDGAIMVITRGQEKELVGNALQRLRSLGISMSGFVYNRAKSRDFAHSPYGSSSYTGISALPTDVASRPRESPQTRRWTSELAKFGPLVQAVGAGAS